LNSKVLRGLNENEKARKSRGKSLTLDFLCAFLLLLRRANLVEVAFQLP